jgi:predicted ArsR family transcriptional regulator
VRAGVLGAVSAHPVRAALLELIRERGSVTSTEAAAALGGNTGRYSFHLRQLARYGLVEEAPAAGRARPWRLPVARGAGDDSGQPDTLTGAGPDLDRLARRLEDESYQRWLDHRHQAPADWHGDAAFSQVLHLTPDEAADLAAAIRELAARFRHRERPAARPDGARPVALVARVFPLLDPMSVTES